LDWVCKVNDFHCQELEKLKNLEELLKVFALCDLEELIKVFALCDLEELMQLQAFFLFAMMEYSREVLYQFVVQSN
jgi:hypothetical protein